MKQKLIVTAITAAIGAIAGTAHAISPGNASVLTNQVYMSGATAQNGGIVNVVRLNCQDGTLDAYHAGNRVAYTCLVRAGSNLSTRSNTPAGTPVSIHKESMGGSSNGINPLLNGTTMSFVDLGPVASGTTSSPCTLDTVSSIATSGSFAAMNVWACPSTQTANVVPQIGFSDVDPPVFGLGTTGPAGTLNLLSPNQLTFGVAVTKALRDSLQAVQGLIVGSDAAAQTPSLNPAQIHNLFRQGKAQTNTGSILGLTGGDATKRIYAVRRGSTSGTQKTAEIRFFNLNVVAPAFTVNAFAAPTAGFNSVVASDAGCGNATANPSSTSMVFAGTSNEEVVNCMNRHQAGNRFAVASLTMEFNAFANPASPSGSITTAFPTGFRYVKINGALPTVENMVKGTYDYFSEQVITSLLGAGVASVPGNVLDTMVAELGNPGNVVAINSTFTKWADLPVGSQASGLLKPGPAAATSCPATYAVAGTNPDTDAQNVITKNPTGTKVSNAMPPVATCPPRF